MSIVMIRIDDRLIHGQIVTAWAKNKNAGKIWVIDTATAKDDFLSGVMKMVAPSDRELVISSEDQINELVPKFDAEPENVLILMKTPEVAKKIFEAGVKLTELNIGGMGANPERKKLFKNISASPSEVQTLKEIQNSGVFVYFQVTPDEKKTEFNF